jgi:DNA-binding MurR/RpiR family transcriptional regulator
MIGDAAWRPPAVLASLRRMRPELPESLRRTADLLLAEPERSVRGTIEELAAAAGTSVGSVSRLCRRLGLDGFRELRIAVTAEVAGAARGTWDTDIGRDFAPTDPLPLIAKTLAVAQARAVHATLDGLPADVVEAAAAAIARAPTVDIFGVSGSAVMAMELDLRLHRIGVKSRVFSDEHAGVTAACLLGPGDVAIAISHSGETAHTLQMLGIAAENGATTVAVTGAEASAIGRLADHVLLTVTEETTFLGGPLASRHAELAAVELLYLAVCRIDPARTAQRLAATAAGISAIGSASGRPSPSRASQTPWGRIDRRRST